jgi:hypothetical protein
MCIRIQRPRENCFILPASVFTLILTLSAYEN